MNRLSPLIVRQARAPGGPFVPREVPAEEARGQRLLDDVQLFLTSFAGGLVFFGTLLL